MILDHIPQPRVIRLAHTHPQLLPQDLGLPCEHTWSCSMLLGCPLKSVPSSLPKCSLSFAVSNYGVMEYHVVLVVQEHAS